MCENHTEKAAAALCQRHNIALCLVCLLNKYHVDCDAVEIIKSSVYENDYVQSIMQLTRDLEKAKDNTEKHLKHVNDFEIRSFAKIIEIKGKLTEKTDSLEANSRETVKNITKGKTDDVMKCKAKLETVENKLQALVDQLNETDNKFTGIHRQISCSIQELEKEMRTESFSQLESMTNLDVMLPLRNEVQSYLSLDSNDKRGYFSELEVDDIPSPITNNGCGLSSDISGSKGIYDSLLLETKDVHEYERFTTTSAQSHIILKQHDDEEGPCKFTKLIALINFLVVCDSRHDYIHLYKMCGTYINGIEFESSWSIKDICVMKENTLAVAGQNQPMITTVRLTQEKLVVEKHITIKGHIRNFQSLGYDTKMKLFVFCSVKEVFIVKVTGDIIHSVKFGTSPKRFIISGLSRRRPRPDLSVSKHAVYDFSTRSVYICDSIQETLERHSLDRREVVWKQTNGLHRPRFILVHGEKIFVACQNEIAVLASDKGDVLYSSMCKGENICLAVLERDSQILVTENSDDCKVSRMIKYVKR